MLRVSVAREIFRLCGLRVSGSQIESQKRDARPTGERAFEEGSAGEFHSYPPTVNLLTGCRPPTLPRGRPAPQNFSTTIYATTAPQSIPGKPYATIPHCNPTRLPPPGQSPIIARWLKLSGSSGSGAPKPWPPSIPSPGKSSPSISRLRVSSKTSTAASNDASAGKTHVSASGPPELPELLASFPAFLALVEKQAPARLAQVAHELSQSPLPVPGPTC